MSLTSKRFFPIISAAKFTDMSRLSTATTLLVAGIAIAMAGCEWRTGALDAEERQEQALRRARELRAVPEQAVEAYRRLLDDNPRMAVAHLDMALLLHDNIKDYVGAVYHYRRYLELRPGAEKAAMIAARIQDALRRFAGQTQGDRPATNTVAGVSTDTSILLDENASLKLEVARLTQELESLRTRPAAVQPPEPPARIVVAPPPEPPPPKQPSAKARTYKVRPRDTLYSISEAVYGDRTQWTRILDANATLLRGEPRRLREGMELTIP
jgi:tetratricopeptide (TPR) repeat protein